MNGKSHSQMFAQERGAVLIVGLIMLLLLTMIGLASIRGTDLQEAMAGNMRDRNLAFQAAEASLRMGEKVLSAASIPSFSGGTLGYWPDLNKSTNYSLLSVGSWPLYDSSSTKRRLRPTDWTSAQWTSNSLQLANNTLSGLVSQPRYTVEQVKVSAAASNPGGAVDVESLEKFADSEYFRVTGYGQGATADSEVILQSTFVR